MEFQNKRNFKEKKEEGEVKDDELVIPEEFQCVEEKFSRLNKKGMLDQNK